LMSYKAYFASTKNKVQRLSWHSLNGQLGAEYSDIQNFRKYALKALKQAEVVYPALKVEVVTGGLEIKPSSPAIPAKAVPKVLKSALPTVEVPIAPEGGDPAGIRSISAEAIEKTRAMVLASGAGWDIYALEQEYYAYAQKKGKPKYPDRAFIGFVKKKIQNRA
jgi:hypothetical protein